MSKYNFRKDWETITFHPYEQVVKKVIKAFSKWESENLTITYGRRERTTSDTYGLPYVSSGDFAELCCHCNVTAVLRKDRNFVIYSLVITKENEIVAYLMDADENEKYIVIGRL